MKVPETSKKKTYNAPFVVSDTPVSNELLSQNLEESIPAGFFEEMGARFEESWVRAPLSSAQRFWELETAKRNWDFEESIKASVEGREIEVETMTEDAWKESEYYREELSFEDMKNHKDEVAIEAAKITAKRKDEEITRQKVLARSPGGFVRSGVGFATDFIAQALDPINVASAFIPVVGPARYANMLRVAAAAGKSKALVRTGVGAIEGLVGNALVEPIVYIASKQEQADYGMADSLINVGMGAFIGGGAHAGLGKLSDMLELRTLKSKQNALKTAVKQIVDGEDVDIGPIREAAIIEETARIKVRRMSEPEIQEVPVRKITAEEKAFAETTKKYDLYEVDGTVIRDPETRRSIILSKEKAIREIEIREKAAKEIEELQKEMEITAREKKEIEEVLRVGKPGGPKRSKLWHASGEDLQKRIDDINKRVDEEIKELGKLIEESLGTEFVISDWPEDVVIRDPDTWKEIVDPTERAAAIKEIRELQRRQAKRDWKEQNKADPLSLVPQEEMIAILIRDQAKHNISDAERDALIKVLRRENLTKQELSTLYEYNKAITDLDETDIYPYIEGNPDIYSKKTYNERIEEIRNNVLDTHQDLFLINPEINKKILQAERSLKQLQQEMFRADQGLKQLEQDPFALAKGMYDPTIAEDPAAMAKAIEELAQDIENKANLARERQKQRAIEDQRLRGTETPQETKARQDRQAAERLEDNRIIEIDNESKSDAEIIKNVQETYSKAIDIARHCIRR